MTYVSDHSDFTSILDACLFEIEAEKKIDELFAQQTTAALYDQRPRPISLPRITNVIFNAPATIVFWNDGTKTVVKCQPGDTFNPETGLKTAMLKRFMGNDNTFNKAIARWLPSEDQSGA